jgi:hypothetical protein
MAQATAPPLDSTRSSGLRLLSAFARLVVATGLADVAIVARMSGAICGKVTRIAHITPLSYCKSRVMDL